MTRIFISKSEDLTKSFAAHLAAYLKQGDVITLSGELGAGKTTFTKGIAAGLGIKRIVTSPTFTIIKEYQGDIPLYHMDTYRLENSDEDIGFNEYFYGEGITVVEWAIFIKEFLPENRLEIELSLMDHGTRKILLKPLGNHFEKIVNEVSAPKGITE